MRQVTTDSFVNQQKKAVKNGGKLKYNKFYKARDNSYIIDPNIILRSLLTFEDCIFLPDIVSVINETNKQKYLCNMNGRKVMQNSLADEVFKMLYFT